MLSIRAIGKRISAKLTDGQESELHRPMPTGFVWFWVRGCDMLAWLKFIENRMGHRPILRKFTMTNVRKTDWVFIFCFGLALASLLSGCQMIGGFYSIFIDPLIPPKIIEAEHDMHDKTVLVWVDDPRVDSQYVLLRRTLTKQLHQELLAKEAVGEVVGYEKIARFCVTHPDYARMSIEELGKKFQADEVLYVFVNDFSWQHEAGKGFYHPQLDGYVKVVDCQRGGERLWPEDRTHQTYTYKGRLEEGRGETFEKNLLKSFSQTVAERLALHFYEHPEKKD